MGRLGVVIGAVKLLVRNGMAGHPHGCGADRTVPAAAAAIAEGVSEVISWPTVARRAAVRGHAERFPRSTAVEEMVNLHATVAAGDVMSTGKAR